MYVLVEIKIPLCILDASVCYIDNAILDFVKNLKQDFAVHAAVLGNFCNDGEYTLKSPHLIIHIPECLTGQNSRNSLSSLLSIIGFNFKSETQIFKIFFYV